MVKVVIPKINKNSQTSAWPENYLFISGQVTNTIYQAISTINQIQQ